MIRWSSGFSRAEACFEQPKGWTPTNISEDDDRALLDRAKSFSTPPSIANLVGARLDTDTYVPERRAIRMTAAQPAMEFKISPGPICVDPVLRSRGCDHPSCE
jgi:hypothetical protein